MTGRGNIRELQNVIERAVILSKGSRLRLDLALAGVPAATPSFGAADDPQLPILTETSGISGTARTY